MPVEDHRTPLTARLAARAVTLALDPATRPEDVADHLLQLSRRDPVILDRAAKQVALRHHHPESAAAQLAIRALRLAARLAVGASPPDGARLHGAVA